ncbi:MAG: hypothetical protein H7A45_03045 [Verrucomicrobiales bacterium]|nr:hypothetical protein [Verrucomicrobiales bacterium]
MLLRDLIHEFRPELIQGQLDRPVRGLAYEVERVAPEMAFFAVRRTGRDGHDEVIEAIRRGALAVIGERTGLVPPRAANIRVRDSRQAMARAASAYYGHPASRLRVLGLTGDGDLPGLAWVLRETLALAGESSGLIGSLRHAAGPHEFAPRPAGDESLDVQRMLASMARSGEATCVMELGPTAHRHGWTAGLRLATLIEVREVPAADPEASGLSDVHPRFCDGSASLDSMGEAGADGMTTGEPDGASLTARRCLRIELQAGAEWQVRLSGNALAGAQSFRVDRFATNLEGSSCRIAGPEGSWRLRCALPGWQNQRRVVLAALIARALGTDATAIGRAVRRLEPVPGSLVPVRGNQPFAVLVDAAREAAALGTLLRDVRRLRPRRILLLMGAEEGTSIAEREALGRVAGALADQAIITSNNPRCEPPAAIARAVRRGAALGARASVAFEPNRVRAIQALLALAGPGDAVLLTGKGHRTTEEADHCVTPFDDHAHALRALEALGWRRAGAASRSRRP